MYSFATPPIKLKLGQQIGGRLLITNHLHQSLWWAKQKHWAAAVRSYLLHSSLQVHSAAEPFTFQFQFHSKNLTGIESLFRVWMVRIWLLEPNGESQSTSNFYFKPLGFQVSLGESIFCTCCGPPSPKKNSIFFLLLGDSIFFSGESIF